MKNLFIFLQIFYILFGVKSECPSNLETRLDQIFVYSTQPSTYNDAESQCDVLDGSLAQITEQDRDLFLPVLNDLYLQGMVEVKIYKTTVNAPSGIYNYHKYRADGFSDDTSSLTSYDRPGIGDLSSIWLSSRFQSEDTNKVQFCYIPPRDVVMRECIIDEGWSLNFELYEETNQSDHTIMLYNYYAETVGATSKFSLNEITDSYWTTDYSDGISAVYLKDISVFIGARSDVNQTKWYWSNDAEVNDPLFPTPNSSLCQQMTWPLTYNDGINLRPKQCETGMSHYVCQVLFSINVDEVVCDATSLNVSWNSLSQLFQDSSNVVGDLQITLQTIPSTRSYEINFSQSHVILDNLNQKTEYPIDVSLQIKDCPTFQVTASSSGRTGYGVPDPVTSAYVNNTNKQCKIIWTHVDDEVQYYQITIQGNLDNDEYLYTYNVADENENETLFYNVDLSLFIPNQTLTFKISSTSSCDLQSTISEVKGSCKTPDLPTTSSSTTTATTPPQCIPNSSLSFETGIGIGVGIGIAAMLLLAVILAFVINYRKQISIKDIDRDPVYEIPMNETHEYSSVIDKKKAVNQTSNKKIYENEGTKQEVIANNQHGYENVQNP